MSDLPQRACWGLCQRATGWRLTWRGRAVLLGALVAAGAGAVLGTMPFLAVTQPVRAECLVVEGWIADYAIQEAVQEYRRHPYRMMFTTGGHLKYGIKAGPYDNYADIAKARCLRFGLADAQVESVPAGPGNRDRTLRSALALRGWFQSKGITPGAINVVSLGPHARRTRLVYGRAFQGRVAVGVIAIPDREYDPQRWWRSSEGVKEVLSEALAYLHARLLSGRSAPEVKG